MTGFVSALGRLRRGARADREARRLAVIAGLQALKSEFPDSIDRGFINDQILYAEVGKSRYELTDEWVQRTRRHLAKNRELLRREAALTKDDSR